MSNLDSKDKLFMDGFHEHVDNLMDDLFFCRRAHIIAGVESEEDIDAYMMESAKQAKAKYEDMTMELAKKEMLSRIIRRLSDIDIGEDE